MYWLRIKYWQLIIIIEQFILTLKGVKWSVESVEAYYWKRMLELIERRKKNAKKAKITKK